MFGKSVKALVCLAAVAFVFCPLFADKWTDPGTGITWWYSVEGKNAKLSSSATSPTTMKHLVIPSTINGFEVTSIGGAAFTYWYKELESVTIPSSVTSIGNNAFQLCEKLVSVTMPSGLKSIGSSAFDGCLSLVSVEIPSSVTNIEYCAFSCCIALTSVTIPEGVTSLPYAVFGSCSSLKSVDIPSSVTNIASAAFQDCSALTSVTIPPSVKEIWASAFEGCSSLESVMIPSSVTRIGETVFRGCSSLKSVTLQPGVESIEDDVFSGCSALKSITIPSSVTYVGRTPFYNCSELASVKFLGNAPELERSRGIYFNAPDNLTTYVTEGSTGWIASGVEGLPEDGMWHGRKIAYWPPAEPIPELPMDATAEEVAAALAGSADARLAANITDAATYAAYRAWAQSVKGADGATAGADAVKGAAYAWLSFALDSATLIDKAPQAGDVTIDAFEVAAADGAFDLVVGVRGVAVGANASPANLAKVFRIEGGATLDEFAADAVDVVFGPLEEGKVKATATPRGGAASSFFLKATMTP